MWLSEAQWGFMIKVSQSNRPSVTQQASSSRQDTQLTPDGPMSILILKWDNIYSAHILFRMCNEDLGNRILESLPPKVSGGWYFLMCCLSFILCLSNDPWFISDTHKLWEKQKHIGAASASEEEKWLVLTGVLLNISNIDIISIDHNSFIE